MPRSDLHRALKQIARRKGKAQAELLREALEEYLHGKSPPRPRSVGMGEDDALSRRDSEKSLNTAWEQR